MFATLSQERRRKKEERKEKMKRERKRERGICMGQAKPKAKYFYWERIKTQRTYDSKNIKKKHNIF